MPGPLERVEALFHAALELPEPERRAYVRRSCADDSQLLREVESLLAHYDVPTADMQGSLQPVAIELLDTGAVGPGLSVGLGTGAMLGPYRIDRKLGEGGMGAVYVATDTRLDRTVAVKTIARAFKGRDSARARFMREARSAAALSHPNIAALYDVGETSGTSWLVMEHVEGVTLRARLAGALDEAVWRRYALQIAAALTHAHSRGIIHRDIKPENILIADGGHVKVIDFGLARAAEEAGTITEKSAFLGTLAYAAPELCAGGSASPRSDVYSLGVVLYEMACGKAPFAGLAGHALVSAILAGRYAGPRSQNPRISLEAAAIIDCAMACEPALRYKDGAALEAALRGADRESAIRPPAPLPVIAVIDFANLGDADDFDWLGTGMAETLTADLAKLGSVRVSSRSRVVQAMRRLGCAPDDGGRAVELGRELAAQWIVTGAYQRLGDRIRVTAELLDAAGGETVAAEKIDGRWEEIFDVQDRVVAAVLRALAIESETPERRKLLPGETRSVAAYEHYVRGRRQMYAMEGKSLSTAIHEFERAIDLDPDYALAYSGLGTANALQFILTSNPDHVVRASGYLERAIELDPELGEPYPWLCNIRLRGNDPEGGYAAAAKGVALQPDLADAQYFYGALFYMLPEFKPGALRSEIRHLGEALRLQPRFHAAWLLLGASAAFLGKHDHALRILTEAVRREREPDLMYRFVGPRTLLAMTHMRAGSWEAARAGHQDAIEALRGTEHIYTTSFEAVSACALGEIELRLGNHLAAQQYFRHARRIVVESPRVAGSARLTIRANTGLAAAYAAAGETSRAGELAAEAARQLAGLSGQTATSTFECSLSQLWLLLAAAEIRLGNIELAGEHLDRARSLGWLDGVWLAKDPELQPMRGHPAYESFRAELASAPEVEIPAVPGNQVASGAA